MEIRNYRPPIRAWRGDLGYIPTVSAMSVTWPQEPGGSVLVALRTAQPVDLSTVARALVRLLLPTNTTAQWGSPQLAVARGTSPEVLALLPDPWASGPQEEPNPDVLAGNDVLIVGENVEAKDPQHRHRFVLSQRGGLSSGRPIIDLRRFNPIGRSPKIDGAFPSRPSALIANGSGIELLIDGKVAGTVDLERHIPDDLLVKLRSCTTLDLSRLILGDLAASRATPLASRLAELAATGIVLHGGAHLKRHLDSLAPEVVDSLQRPQVPETGLANTLLGVAQRRAAMREHGGVLRFGAELSRIGFGRALPHVSVLLVTNRPEMVESAVRRMRLQTYPDLDVIVLMHGTETPDLDRWAPCDREIVSDIVEVDVSVPFGDVLAQATSRATGPLVLKIDDDDLYGREFVWDLVLARLFSGAQVVGKQPEFTYIEPFDVTVRRGFVADAYGEQVAGGAMLMSAADIAASGGWRGVPRAVDRALMQRVLKAGGIVYVDRGVGFLYVRHGRGHTWEAAPGTFLRNVHEQWSGMHLAVLGASDGAQPDPGQAWPSPDPEDS